ncbi:MAG: putative DNA-binding domain-containing protein [Proteobacteria bacterium]|nr:putative DNA-binding domain-containing protein [Pseudomonadota bacterium]
MSLAQLQQTMIGWLRSGDPALAQGLGGGAGPAVYLNNHRAALMAALENAYAQTRAWLGDATFAAAAARHIEAHEPVSWTLDAYGAGFAETLAELFADDPEVADLARLEWALEQAFVAADAAPLRLADLAAIDWDQARLAPVPSCRHVTVTTNAAEILAALIDEGEPPTARALTEPQAVLVWRLGYVPRFRPLQAGDEFLQGELRFAELCARLVNQMGEEEGIALAGAALARWAGEELCLLCD